MHYWPLIVLAFMAGPAWGQAELSTIISPTTFPVSPAAGVSPYTVTATGSPATVVVPAGNVTATGSPATVNISGAALGVVQVNVAGGSTLPVSINAPPPGVSIVNLVVPVSQAAGTSAFSITATGSPTTVVCAAGCASAGASPSAVTVTAGNVTATGSPATVIVSASNTLTVSEGIVGVSATGSPATVVVPSVVAISPAVGVSAFSVTATGSPTTVICAAGCASAGASPSTVVVSAGNVTTTGSPATVNVAAGTVTATGSPATVVVAAQATLTVSPVAGVYVVSPATGTSAFIISTATGTLVTSPVAATIPVSMSGPVSLVAGTVVSLNTTPTVSVAGAVSLATTTTVSLAGTTLTSVPLQVPIAEQNGSAWPDRANFFAGSTTTGSAAAVTLVNAPASGRLYVTSLGCGRSDSATSAMTVAFNISASAGGKYTIAVPPPSNAGMYITLTTPLSVAATQPLLMQASSSPSVLGLTCSAAGYVAQ